MNKKNKYSLLLLICLTVIAIGAGMRKEVGRQEIIPLDKRIAIINGESEYLNDKLSIKLTGNDLSHELKMNSDGYCSFDNLKNGETYTLTIRRHDLIGRLKYKPYVRKVTPDSSGVEYVVLVGASIGQGWHFDKIPERLKFPDNVIFGNRTIYEFDKGRAIASLANLPVPVSAVIIKQCSAYFPRELNKAKENVVSWIEQLAKAGIKPVLATIVPVTKGKSAKAPDKFKSLLAYNDFVRDYGRKKNIQILDLEASLRIGSKDRHMQDKYAIDDGVHLKPIAYHEALDGLVVPLLKRLKIGIN